MDAVILQSLRYTSSQRLWALAILNWSNRLPGAKSARNLSHAVRRLAATIPGRECHQEVVEMTDIIDAKVFRGCGVASKNLKFQLPHLVWQFPEIKDIFPGSINVQLDAPLHNLNYDYATLPT